MIAVTGGANIAVVERETGLGKDTLRVWERRYGFPQPQRDDNGDRIYPVEQISRLRLIKRLMDRGHRPGRLVTASETDLRALAEAPGAAPAIDGEAAAAPSGASGGANAELAAAAFERLRLHDVGGLRAVLSQWLAKDGLKRFVLEAVPGLSALVGAGWQGGQIQIFEEHLYSEQMHALLRQAIASLPPGTRRPTILLTTLPEEQHVLGILMLEALFTLQGVRCVSLGTQTPIAEIVAATAAHRADVVALSFSGAFASRQVLPLLEQLRGVLPASVSLWAGGAGVGKTVARQLERRQASAGALGAKTGLEGIVIGRSLLEAFQLAEQASAGRDWPLQGPAGSVVF